MPEEKVREMWNSNVRSAGAFAAHFAVSTAAASHRLKRLNLQSGLNSANAVEKTTEEVSQSA
jgi:Zn-dependent peptidase ImmA (M78 family)